MAYRLYSAVAAEKRSELAPQAAEGAARAEKLLTLAQRKTISAK